MFTNAWNNVWEWGNGERAYRFVISSVWGPLFTNVWEWGNGERADRFGTSSVCDAPILYMYGVRGGNGERAYRFVKSPDSCLYLRRFGKMFNTRERK